MAKTLLRKRSRKAAVKAIEPAYEMYTEPCRQCGAALELAPLTIGQYEAALAHEAGNPRSARITDAEPFLYMTRHYKPCAKCGNPCFDQKASQAIDMRGNHFGFGPN